MSERTEDLILVDALDRPIGTAAKGEAHAAPLLHRAFSVFLCDGERLLLQKRAAGKYHSGGQRLLFPPKMWGGYGTLSAAAPD